MFFSFLDIMVDSLPAAELQTNSFLAVSSYSKAAFECFLDIPIFPPGYISMCATAL